MRLLVTRARRRRLIVYWYQQVAPRSVLVTHPAPGSACGHSPDAPCARRGLAPPAQDLGSNPGLPPWTASGADWPTCSRADRHCPSSTADGEHYADQAGIIARNCDTCAVFECSSIVALRPPMIATLWTITPPGRARRRTRSRSEEDGLQRPLEEDSIEENDTFTPAELLLFRNGAGTIGRSSGARCASSGWR